MIACRLPSSSTAWRTALIRVVSADSLTKRSPQISSSSSSLRTTLPRRCDEVREDVEGLRLELDLLAVAPQDDAIQVQLAVREPQNHADLVVVRLASSVPAGTEPILTRPIGARSGAVITCGPPICHDGHRDPDPRLRHARAGLRGSRRAGSTPRHSSSVSGPTGSGFAAVTVMEHHASTDGYLPSPIVLAAAAAARTRNIVINIASMILPLYEPLRAAEDLAILDLVAEGRLFLIVGGGYREEEYEQFGLSIDDRPARMEHAIETLRQAWTGEPFDYEGRTVRILPRPHTPGRAADHPRRHVQGRGPSRRAHRRRVPALRAEVLRGLSRGAGAPGPAGPAADGSRRRRPVVRPRQRGPRARLGAHRAARAARDERLRQLGEGQPGPSRTGASRTSTSCGRRGRYLVLTPDECIALARERGGLFLKPLMGGLDPDVAWESLELIESKVLPELGVLPAGGNGPTP